MLYLLESGEHYKIGYTANLEGRLKQYRTHNPDCELVDTMAGTKKEEHELQNLCIEFFEVSEWFRKDPAILHIWKTYKLCMERYLPIIKKLNNLLETSLDNQAKAFRNFDKLLELQYSRISFIKNLKIMLEQNYSNTSIVNYVAEYIEEEDKKEQTNQI